MSIEIKPMVEVIIDGDRPNHGTIYMDHERGVVFSAPILPMTIEQLTAVIEAMKNFNYEKT